MKYLILGGRGFLGSHLALALIREGYRVRIFDRPNTAAALSAPGAEFMSGDFVNREELTAALKGCEVAFQLVSTTLPQSSNDNPHYDVETNLVGTLRLLDLTRACGTNKTVFSSSGGKIYGVPQRIPIPENHPTDPVQIWGNGEIVRDYVYAGDVAEAFIKAARYPGAYRVFNIGTGRGCSLNELLSRLEALLGQGIKRDYLPGRPFDAPANVLNIGLARTELEWTPRTPLETGITRTAEWITKTVGAG